MLRVTAHQAQLLSDALYRYGHVDVTPGSPLLADIEHLFAHVTDLRTAIAAGIARRV